QLDDTCDFVEVTERGMQRRQNLNRYAAGRFRTLRGNEIFTELANPGLAVFFGDVPGNEEEIARANNGDKSSHGRLSLGERDFQSFETLVDGHRGSLVRFSGCLTRL